MNHSNDLVKSSNLYREFQAESEEILKHKWIESEKAGYDIGFEHALTEWIIKHRSKWRKSRQQQGSRDNARVNASLHQAAAQTTAKPLVIPTELHQCCLLINIYKDKNAFLQRNALPRDQYEHDQTLAALAKTYEIKPSGVLLHSPPMVPGRKLEGGILMSEYRPGVFQYTVHVHPSLELILGLNEALNLKITAIAGTLSPS